MQEGFDQAFHFLWAFAVIAPVLAWPRISVAVLSALLLCLPRELVDQWHGWPIGYHKLLDISFFVLGGFFAALFCLKIKKNNDKN